MAKSDTLRSEIARIAKKEADLHHDLASQQGNVAKYQREANKKAESAAKSKSDSNFRMHTRSSESSAKKAADAQKKVAEIKRKISDLQKAKAGKEKGLRSAEEAERKADQKARDGERKKDITHAKEVARVTAPTRYVIVEPPKPEKLRVLYLTANPEAAETSVSNPDGSVATNGIWLRVDAEVRNVRKEVRGALHRDAMEISHRPAATYEDMLEGLNDIRPHIVHFSGHGGGRGLLFDNGSVDAPDGVEFLYENLVEFLSATDHPPTLLVLNACDTLEGSEVLLPAVPVVVAMSDSISDAAASIFAGKFYAAVASGQSIGSSLNQAKAVLGVIYPGEKNLPQFRSRDDVELDRLVLVTGS